VKGGIEATGATEAITCFLLQSTEGFLHFFPNWPRTLNAKFSTLGAIGGFTVSAQYEPAHGVKNIEIKSLAGTDVTFKNPFNTTNIVVKQCVELSLLKIITCT
jgi:hypothetical protein